MTDHTTTGRRRSGAVRAAVLTALVAVSAAACSGGDESAASSSAAPTSAPAAASAPVSPAADPIVKGSADPATPTTPIDPSRTLQAALDGVAAGTHFRTVVTVDGTEILVAEGDRVGDGSRLTIWSNGTSVSYVILASGTWAVPDGGEWELLDTPPAATDPLAALRAPTAISGAATGDGMAALVVSADAVTLGITTTGTVDVTVTTVGLDAAASLSTVSYATSVDGRAAQVTTTFSPVVDASPVVPPI
jgi:hypothetical protein